MKTRIRAAGAALAAATTLAVVAAPAQAVRSVDHAADDGTAGYVGDPTAPAEYEAYSGKYGSAQPDGNYPSQEACDAVADVANSFIATGDALESVGQANDAMEMWERADNLAQSANDEGCNLFFVD